MSAYQPEYLELRVKLRRVDADGTRTTVWMGPIDQLGNLLEETAAKAELAEITPRNQELLRIADRFPAPQTWYDEAPEPPGSTAAKTPEKDGSER